MLKKRTCLLLSLILLLTVIIPVTAEELEPYIENGILYYGEKQLDLKPYQFVSDNPYDLQVPNESFRSALYYKPQLMGEYIYLIAAVFIENKISLTESFDPDNHSIMGDVYNILIRIPVDTMSPGMIGWAYCKTLRGFRWTFDINEGDKDNMGVDEQEVLYNWGRDVLIPQLIKSKYHPDTMYAVFEIRDVVIDKMVFHFGYYTREELESNSGACKQLFYVNYTQPYFADREHGACYFEELEKDTILVRYFPKDYKGEVYDNILDISEYGNPKVIKTRHFPMPDAKGSE